MNRILAAAIALLIAVPAVAMTRPPRAEPPPPPVPVFTDPAVVTLGDRRFIFAGPGVPATLAPRVPVVVMLHGGGGSADRQVDANRLQDAARANDFIIAFPDAAGADSIWLDGRPGGESDADVVFLRLVIDWLAANANADASRVYFTGFSNGGAMTHRMACEAADLVAGAAPVSSAPAHELAASCAPSRPVPLLVIQGTLPPISGGAGQEATAASVARWANTNGCGAPVASALPDVDPADGTTTTRRVYPCSGAALEWYEVLGGGHTWAGNEPTSGAMASRMGPTSQDFDPAAVMVDFFGLRRP